MTAQAPRKFRHDTVEQLQDAINSAEEMLRLYAARLAALKEELATRGERQ